VIEDGVNGLLVDFFDSGAMADRVVAALDNAQAMRPLREAAMLCVKERYSLTQGEGAFRALLSKP
jgi:glycosyltransferase involved in cell wall biosynthesis